MTERLQQTGLAGVPCEETAQNRIDTVHVTAVRQR